LEGTGDFVIKEPMLLDDMVDIASGRQMVTMTKYIWFDMGDIVTFQKAHVISKVAAVEEIASYYQTTLNYYNRDATKKLLGEVKKTERILSGLITGKSKKAATKQPKAIDGRFVVPGTGTLQ
jgi:hypothetical protein